MFLSDTITSYDNSGLTSKHVRSLSKAGIFDWSQAKTALENGSLKEICGIGDLAISLIKSAKLKGVRYENR